VFLFPENFNIYGMAHSEYESTITQFSDQFQCIISPSSTTCVTFVMLYSGVLGSTVIGEGSCSGMTYAPSFMRIQQVKKLLR
jgi:hypothetical protein